MLWSERAMEQSALSPPVLPSCNVSFHHSLDLCLSIHAPQCVSPCFSIHDYQWHSDKYPLQLCLVLYTDQENSAIKIYSTFIQQKKLFLFSHAHWQSWDEPSKVLCSFIMKLFGWKQPIIWLPVNAKSVVFANWIALNTNTLLLFNYYEPKFYACQANNHVFLLMILKIGNSI